MGNKSKKNIRMRMKNGSVIDLDPNMLDRIDIPNLVIKRQGQRKNNRLVLDLREDKLDKAIMKELKKKNIL